MSILSKFGLPENIIPPLPPGAKDGSPYSIGLANQQASMNKMSNLLQVTQGQGGGKIRRNRSIKRGRRLLKGGAAVSMITLPPLNVPYPGGSGLNNTYTRLATTAVNGTEQSRYDTAWVKPSVGGSIKRSSKRSRSKKNIKRSNKKNIKRSIKRSIRYKR